MFVGVRIGWECLKQAEPTARVFAWHGFGAHSRAARSGWNRRSSCSTGESTNRLASPCNKPILCQQSIPLRDRTTGCAHHNLAQKGLYLKSMPATDWRSKVYTRSRCLPQFGAARSIPKIDACHSLAQQGLSLKSMPATVWHSKVYTRSRCLPQFGAARSIPKIDACHSLAQQGLSLKSMPTTVWRIKVYTRSRFLP